MNEFLPKLHDLLKNSEHLKFVKNWGLCDDPHSFVTDMKFPFVNVDGYSLDVESIPKFGVSGDKHSFSVVVHFATSHKKKKIAVLGGKDDIGIWQLQKAIWNTIKEDKSILGSVVSRDTKPRTIQLTQKLTNTKYISLAEIHITFSNYDFIDKEVIKPKYI